MVRRDRLDRPGCPLAQCDQRLRRAIQYMLKPMKKAPEKMLSAGWPITNATIIAAEAMVQARSARPRFVVHGTNTSTPPENFYHAGEISEPLSYADLLKKLDPFRTGI
jgi:hypothetical protein